MNLRNLSAWREPPFGRNFSWRVTVLAAVGAVTCSPRPQAARDPVPVVRTARSGVDDSSLHEIAGLDAHDGKIVEWNGTYYLFGTRYGIGSSPACATQPFEWAKPGTPWCGFGVWTSTNLHDWSYGGLLFDPLDVNTTVGDPSITWQFTCSTNQNTPLWSGCFNPRMLRRHDGAWILWFNAPAACRVEDCLNRDHAYFTMACQGPAGPCGPEADRPRLSRCLARGDFDIADTQDGVFLVCTRDDQTLSIEQLDESWRHGVKDSGADKLAGLTKVEAPSIFGSGSDLYVTYSQEACGYCNTNGTGWAHSTNGMLGNWSVGGVLSANSCRGQPRTVNWLAGKPWQWIDQWTPDRGPTQDKANVLLQLLQFDGDHIRPFDCSGT